MTSLSIYKELRLQHSLKQIADALFLHTGTLKRWEEKGQIPNEYLYDLNFLLGNKYDLKKQGFRFHNEFFTKKEVAKHCFNVFMEFCEFHKINVKDYVFIEPSCGDLSFYDLMPKNARIGIDLEYKNDEILRQNFLSFIPQKTEKKFIVLGNPPFGLRGNLALRFIKHASKFADFIAFILPPLFNSDGKGSPKKRISALK